MSIVESAGIWDALADPRILPAARYGELVRDLMPKCSDWAILGPELVYRDWFTPFQLNSVLQGTGNKLVLGSFVLEEPIGEGAMGRIYRARNWKLGTTAAIKVIRSEKASDAGTVNRFLREICALGAIRHPNIVHAFDADYERNQLYCAMEYVPGTDLGKLLRHSNLSIQTACTYAAQIADALAHIGSLGLVHRDVKPSNILVTECGKTVKLADLGLARICGPSWDADSPDLTRHGTMIGTPDYTAPEQIRSSSGADVRSDLYSLGCTLYHMLTGVAPFQGLDITEVIHHQLNCEPVPVEKVRPDVPMGVAEVVRTLMAKRPRDRYQDPGEPAALLRAAALGAAETLTGQASTTSPNLPLISPDWGLPRTVEIPFENLHVVTSWSSDERRSHQLRRYVWLVFAAVAGLATGLAITW